MILARRDAIPVEDREAYSGKIKERMLKLPCYRDAEAVFAYVSCRSEVNTIGLIRQALSDGKQVFAPKVAGDEMEFWQIGSLSDLSKGYQGIPEPAETISYQEFRNSHPIRRTLMWMPGTAFDRQHHRIGYGRGFYDRYLERFQRTSGEDNILTTAALAYSCQVLERIPCEAHDHRPDYLLTEQGLI